MSKRAVVQISLMLGPPKNEADLDETVLYLNKILEAIARLPQNNPPQLAKETADIFAPYAYRVDTEILVVEDEECQSMNIDALIVDTLLNS